VLRMSVEDSWLFSVRRSAKGSLASRVSHGRAVRRHSSLTRHALPTSESSSSIVRASSGSIVR
jgi:hypothetical protein